jgi:hypothetical protein
MVGVQNNSAQTVQFNSADYTVVAGAIVGGGITYGGYKLYGMLSSSSNVAPNQSQNQNNVLGKG